ncbi:MAG: lipopolysaccharide kinase InaA family protein [Planctomycetota bacterium]|nr:lipopolysaccharide kinase InaA family protein [Planctomycetota bacterium]
MRQAEETIHGWLDPDWLRGAIIAEVLEELLHAIPEAPLRSVPTRQTFSWPSEAPTAIVKRTRGDQFRDRWYDYLRGSARSPGQREFENLRDLARAGIPVPRPLGWGAMGSLSFVLMERVEHSKTLRQSLEEGEGSVPPQLLDGLAQLVASLHRAGWYHRDLYLEHVILRPDGSLCLLDLGRARQQASPRSRWLAKDLGALLHSLPDRIPAATRLRFLARYLDLCGIHGARARRTWARAAEQRRARIASHAPRHVSATNPAS